MYIIGFEIAQSNAAYIIRTKLNSAHTAHSTLTLPVLPWSSPWRMLTTRQYANKASNVVSNNISTETAESIQGGGVLVPLLKDGIGASDRVLYILHYRLQKSEYATIYYIYIPIPLTMISCMLIYYVLYILCMCRDVSAVVKPQEQGEHIPTGRD